ncbi:RNA polymerase sigma factor [Bacteroides timonensis]|uniref:RNA polymerase sigma factor n=1 Tax=Bacteroides timonensis TaxID=1470345 RepID=UPI0005C5BE4E
MHRHDNITDMDERSFKCFVETYSDDLLYYARYLLRSKEEAQEVVSDVFFEVWQNRGNLAEIKRMKVWLLTVTHNKAISYLRKNNASVSPVSWDELGDHVIPANLQTPDERLISQEEMGRIDDAVNSLPPRCKQVFVLAKIEKLPYKEISAMLNISVKTINVHIAKALELISATLKK